MLLLRELFGCHQPTSIELDYFGFFGASQRFEVDDSNIAGIGDADSPLVLAVLLDIFEEPLEVAEGLKYESCCGWISGALHLFVEESLVDEVGK